MALEHALDDLAAREVSEVARVGVRGVRGQGPADRAQAGDVALGRGVDRHALGPVGAHEEREVLLDLGGARQLVEHEARALGVVAHGGARVLERAVDGPLLGGEVGVRGDVEASGHEPLDEPGALGLLVLGARALAQPLRQRDGLVGAVEVVGEGSHGVAPAGASGRDSTS